MTGTDIREFLALVPAVKQTPEDRLRATYDREADVLYVSFGAPRQATDSELADEDVVLRYEGEKLIGLTILHASQR